MEQDTNSISESDHAEDFGLRSLVAYNHDFESNSESESEEQVS